MPRTQLDDMWDVYTAAAREHVGPYKVDTIPSNTSTAEVISAPGTRSSTVDTIGDHDWFRVTLTPGETYNFSLVRAPGTGGLTNPYLALYNSSGTRSTAPAPTR